MNVGRACIVDRFTQFCVFLGNLKVPESTVARKLISPKLNVVRKIAPLALRIKVGSHSLKTV